MGVTFVFQLFCTKSHLVKFIAIQSSGLTFFVKG